MTLKTFPHELTRLQPDAPHVLGEREPKSAGMNLEDLAIVTHYLQSVGTPQQRHYTSLARKHGLLDLSKWLRESEISWNVPFKPSLNAKFTFIDLFAGIGGMRQQPTLQKAHRRTGLPSRKS